MNDMRQNIGWTADVSYELLEKIVGMDALGGSSLRCDGERTNAWTHKNSDSFGMRKRRFGPTPGQSHYTLEELPCVREISDTEFPLCFFLFFSETLAPTRTQSGMSAAATGSSLCRSAGSDIRRGPGTGSTLTGLSLSHRPMEASPSRTEHPVTNAFDGASINRAFWPESLHIWSKSPKEWVDWGRCGSVSRGEFQQMESCSRSR
jgi:hypothetical protein